MFNIIAQINRIDPMSWSIGQLLITVVAVAAAIALVWIALRQFKVDIPPWVIQVFWVVVVALVVIFAIRLVLGA